MILIDATYINQSGGLQLLELLFKNISTNKILFLLDLRIINHDLIKQYNNINFTFIKPSEFSRLKYYLKNKTELKKVLCLANVPPPIKLKCEVYTYFHNVILVDEKLRSFFSFKTRFYFKLKLLLIKWRKKNTDIWFIQTTNVRDLLISNLRISTDKIELMPFFDDTIALSEQRKNNCINSFFYPAVGLPHKNHSLILNIWEKLYLTENFNHPLHLTIDIKSDLGKIIDHLQKRGIPIINHGYLNKKEIIELYKECKYTIHPSLGESFGLVLIEAIQYGCVLIAPELPYVKAIVTPNYFFDINKPNSLIKTIKKALLDKECIKSKILIKNEISVLISQLLN